MNRLRPPRKETRQTQDPMSGKKTKENKTKQNETKQNKKNENKKNENKNEISDSICYAIKLLIR